MIHYQQQYSVSFRFISNHCLVSKTTIESSIRRNATFMLSSPPTTSPRNHLVTGRYHMVVWRSIEAVEQDEETRQATYVLTRERRGREFLDPFSNVTRLMGERSSVGFSSRRPGNFSYARFRGKNKTGCRKRNDQRASRLRSSLPSRLVCTTG